MILKELTPEQTKEILTEMCKRVGLKYEDVDFSKEGWYMAHTWTEQEQDDFRKWLGEYLKKHKNVGKRKYRGQDGLS